MKIAIVVNELNVRGGTHKQVLRLCQYLCKENIDFVLCTKYYESNKTYPEFAMFNVISLHNESCKINQFECSIPAKIKQFLINMKEDKILYDMIPDDVTIINVHDTFLANLMKIAIKHKKKIVWQINDLNSAFNVGAWKFEKDSLLKFYKRNKIKQIAKKIDKITVNVSKNKDRVRQCLNKDATVLYCGVDENNLLKKHNFFYNNDFKLLSMGVFFPYRNYETLVEIIKKMRSSGKNISLDIIGNTMLHKAYSEKIINMIKDYNMEKHIRIHGQVDDKTYADLFNGADAFSFINIDQSWGLAVFEAMSCGLPTIVSNSVGAIELLHDNKDSIIVDPLNVDEISKILERLMTDSDYYNKISNNAYYAVKNYTWDAMYSSKLVDIFKELEEKQSL